jgi:GNAT superfamily N-acetyltransferase
MPAKPTPRRIEIRAYAAEDREFLARIAPRIRPTDTASPRDPAAMDRFIHELSSGGLLTDPGAEAFVAMIDGEPCGLIAVHPDVDYFTGHPRAHVDILVVAAEAEGRGVGRALMNHVEQWAREKACQEVVLNVFATNDGAIRFYERCGYRADHFRMAKPLN